MSESPEVAQQDVASHVRDVAGDAVEEAHQYARSSTDQQEVEARCVMCSVFVFYSFSFHRLHAIFYFYVLENLINVF